MAISREDVLHVASIRTEQAILAGVSLVLGFVVFFLMDRNTVISGSQMKRREALARAAAAAPESR